MLPGKNLPPGSDPSDAASLVAAPQVVHLTTTPAPTKSSDMTQQQKIAAALTRAGLANPAAWSTPASSPHTTPDVAPLPEDRPTRSSHIILLSAGSLLALTSLLAFLLIR